MFPSFNARALGRKFSARESLRLAHLAGFAGVDVLIRDALEEGDDLDGLRTRMDDLGLRAGAFPFPFDWRDSSRFAEGLRHLPRYAAAAAKLGLTRTATWVLPEGDESNGSSIFELHLARLAPIARILDDFGIRLGLEVIGVESSRTGRGRPFIHRLSDLEPLRAAISGEAGARVGVLIDSWHLYAAGETIDEALACSVENIVWVHVADLPSGASPDRSAMIDAERGLPGEHGAVETRRLLEALDARGYDGPVTAEPLGGCRSLVGLSSEAVAHKVAGSLRSVWPD